MKQRYTLDSREEVEMFFGATPIARRTPGKSRQLSLVPMDINGHTFHFLTYVGKEIEVKRDARQLRENTASTAAETSAMVMLIEVVAAVEALQLLEAIYGYISDKGCKIVGIANELSDEQRDLIWDVNWEYQGKYPHMNIEVLLIQRYNRPISELYNGDTAIIKRVLTLA
jgi:hypothetical protein